MEHTGVSRKSPNDSSLGNAESNRHREPIFAPLLIAVLFWRQKITFSICFRAIIRPIHCQAPLIFLLLSMSEMSFFYTGIS